ncbi:MAG: hypothetical protein EOP04_22550, partial [Proteobacteria bacterium]
GLIIANVSLAETPVPKQVWKLKAQHSTKCLDVKDAGNTAGSPIVQNDCTDSETQNFYLHEWKDGAFSLIAQTSSLCISVKEKSPADASPLELGSCLGIDSQKVSVWRSSDGIFNLKFQSTSKCLDINDAGEANQNACNTQKNQDWLFTKVEGVTLTEIPKQPIVFIDTSDEMNAEARPFNINNLKNAQYIWEVFDFAGSEPIVLDDSDSRVDLLALGQYAGKMLRVSLISDGNKYAGEYPLMISKVEILQAASNIYKPGPSADLGLIGTRPDLILSYEVRRREACQKKFVISMDGVFTQVDCTNFVFPDFKPGQEETIRIAAISALNTLFKKVKNNTSGAMEYEILQCAAAGAKADQGEFKRSKEAKDLVYNHDNASTVVKGQLDRWNERFSGNFENVKIHFAMNYQEKPKYVLGHAAVGQVQKDLSFIRLQNDDKSRFEIHLNHNLISEDADKAKTVDLILKDGTVFPYSTDVKELAGTLAHEMIH